MHKRWSVSYSYSNNGNETSEVIHNYHDDGNNIYEDGYSRTQNKDLDEKFYKIKSNQHTQSKKTLLGKSKNKKNWELYGDDNGIKQKKTKKYNEIQNHFMNKPSSKHRLEDSLQRNSNNNELIVPKQKKEKQNDNFLKMFEKMNLEMNDFFENDFFYN